MVEPIVDVIMPAYNQENYIAQAIESVLMQETDFNFRLIIGEDCSTDYTRTICQKYADRYPDKIKLIENKANLGLLRNYKRIFEECSGKYIAILEGDDYWIDSEKIERQVKYLEQRPEVGLVHTDCSKLYETGKIIINSHRGDKGRIKNGQVFNQLVLDNYIRPVTVMFRRRLFEKYVSIDSYEKLDFKTLDYPMWLDISQHSEFHYLDYPSAVYRIHSQSISHSNEYQKNIDFLESTIRIKNYAIQKNNCSQELVDKYEHEYLMKRITLNMYYRQYRKVFELGSKLNIKGIKSLILYILTKHRYLVDFYSFINNKRRRIKRREFENYF